ncbi:MAG TPA: hypothetical protein VFK06_15245 [Candidatus Angelobacter sp.]|nr:hypothetical protein [Candidatus Angelobacter sp.]
MARKRKPQMLKEEDDLWINPLFNMRGPDGNRSRANRGNITPSDGSKFLELANIALGLKKTAPKKKKVASAAE